MSIDYDRLTEIEARLEAATPEPWKLHGSSEVRNGQGLPIANGRTTGPQMNGQWVSPQDMADNLALIANAPTDIRDLLALVRTQAEAMDRVRKLAAEDSMAEQQKRIAAEAERDALRAEVARLGPVECIEIRHANGLMESVYSVRRVVKEGVGDGKQTHDSMGRRAEEL
jgi:hypothetical protein